MNSRLIAVSLPSGAFLQIQLPTLLNRPCISNFVLLMVVTMCAVTSFASSDAVCKISDKHFFTNFQ